MAFLIFVGSYVFNSAMQAVDYRHQIQNLEQKDEATDDKIKSINQMLNDRGVWINSVNNHVATSELMLRQILKELEQLNKK